MHYEKKSEWAAAQAADAFAQIQALRREPSSGSTSRARQKFERIEQLAARGRKFGDIAHALRARGQ